MDYQTFSRLVKQLEHDAKYLPKRYRAKLLGLIFLGNLYMLTIIAASIVLFVLLIRWAIYDHSAILIKFSFVIGFFLYHIFRALWLKTPAPEGLKITQQESPALFKMVNELKAQLKTAPIHNILITHEFNAGALQIPRLGFLGWQKNYLILGLPLIAALSSEQLKAVIAHELGHFAHNHNRLSNWIYRHRLRWERLVHTLEQNDSLGNIFFLPFLKWYSPYLNAYSFPLARANEYEADATSVRLTSSRTAAEALTMTNIIGYYLNEHFWLNLHKQADDLPQPTLTPYSQMPEKFSMELHPSLTQKWLDMALKEQTDIQDTHPALNDRLKAIQEYARISLPDENQSATTLLGHSFAKICHYFDKRWQEHVQSNWSQHYQETQKKREHLSLLNAQHGPLSLNERIEQATLTAYPEKNIDEAIKQLRSLHAIRPDHVMINFYLGKYLLEQDNDEGGVFIERVMELDRNTAVVCCQILRDYHWHRERKEVAQSWHQQWLIKWQEEQAIQAEREQITAKDIYELSGLPEEKIQQIQKQLQNIAGLKKAYLVRKVVTIRPEEPCYMIAYRAIDFFERYRKEKILAVLEKLKTEAGLPPDTLILNLDGDNQHHEKRFKKVKGSRIR